ncbi:10721_t:CDS:2 [Acaulospora morrowiae]|uniref:10721_t:CDS:1 n=1 Tax=Acaulospora morrowiae TaxID=94023 RepID=A0A9N8YQX7_9GLOM|nr:10721_t:CDS:2 [Acaulospora morrowiae]
MKILYQFSITKEIARGGFGIIEYAEWATFGRKVALKRLKTDKSQLDEESLLEFKREIKLLKVLHHPNLNQFYGVTKG